MPVECSEELIANVCLVQLTANLRIQVEDSSGTQIAGATDFMLDNVQAAIGLKHFDSTAGDTQWVRVVARNRETSTNSVSTLSYFSLHKL